MRLRNTACWPLHTTVMRWLERLNTDSAHYGGSHVGQPLGAAHSEAVAAHGQAQSLCITLPPLACVFYQWTD